MTGLMPLLAAGAEQAANPLEFNLDLAIFTLIVFLGLIFILGRFAWKPIIDGLERREQSIADDIDAARMANEQAQATLKQYEDRLASVAQEANEIVTRARQEAQAVKDRLVTEAGAEARRERDKALAEIRAAKEAAVRELAERSAQSAVDLAGTILGRSLQREDHARLVEESIGRFVSKN
ncbi:MAG TPA: F0F1 ATP synthase subunit B [Pirellulaceae bacterium]|nr:F0F1 ATP synthase subunit B [Pirellulaceae bacterium]